MAVMAKHYEKRMQKVIDHIYQHLGEKIDLNRLAEVACVSPYHWHRIYLGLYGETLAATVKRLRLHKAAGLLVNTAQKVDEITKGSGYGSLSSFTRAFSEAYGMPPARYRDQGSHLQFKLTIENAGSNLMNNVEIKTLPSIEVLAFPHKGSYMDVGKAFEKLFTWVGIRGLMGPEIRSLGIYIDDPDSVAEVDLNSKACVVLPDMQALDIESPLEKVTLAGGEYAVLRHKGPYAEMRSVYNWLYGQWLPNSGHEVADAPVFEDYLNNPREVAATELLTDIYLPLK